MIGTATTIRNTTKGSTTTVVREGTVLYIHAKRMDPDGLQLLASLSPAGSRFQVPAADTDWRP